MISEGDLESVTVRRLAGRLGVSPAAYAYHFPDKATLLLAIATEGFRRMNEAFRPALEIDDPFQRFYALGQRYLDFALANPGHYRVMFGSHAGLGHDHQCDQEFVVTATAAFEALYSTVEKLLREAANPDERNPLEVSMMIWSQIHGGVSLWKGRMFDPVDKAESTWDEQAFRGLMDRTAVDIAELITGRRVPAVHR